MHRNQYAVFGFAKFAALIWITRPLNVLITGLSIFVAAVLVEPFRFTAPIGWAMLSGMLIAAGANVINDLYDIEIDKINRPQRILPAGRLTAQTARIFTIFLFACGNFFSIFINEVAAAIAASNTLLLIIYTPCCKRRPMIGNLLVSTVTAMAFIFGAHAAAAGLARLNESAINKAVTDLSHWHQDWRAGIFPALFSFLFHFGREVIKDIEDQIGDRAVQARTLPLTYGLRAAQIAATIAFILLFVVTWLPFQLGIYRQSYFLLVLGGVDSVLLVALYVLWKNPVPLRMRQISALLKFDMLIGLAAIYLGK